MRPEALLAVSPTDSATRGMVLVSFLGFIVVILFLSVFIGPERDSVDDFYAAGRKGGPLRGALALSGAFVSAYTILGVAGLVTLSGYDGMLVAAANMVAFGTVLPLASRLRERGRYTLGDLLADRLPGASIRIATALVTLAAVIPSLIMALAVAGAYLAGVLGLSGIGAARALTGLFGCLVVCATVFGGMPGTRVMQMIKTVVVFLSLFAALFLLLNHYGGSVEELFTTAVAHSGHSRAFLRTGLLFGNGPSGMLDLTGMVLTIALGAALMPNVIMHLTTVPDGRIARRMTRHTISMVGTVCAAVGVLGLGGAALVGAQTISAADPTGNLSMSLLVNVLTTDMSSVGGALFITLMASGAFMATLAVVAGLTLAAAATISHDVYAQVLGRDVTQLREVSAARWASAGVGAVCVLLAVLAQATDMQWMATLSFSVAASCILPAVLAALLWRRCTRAGMLWTLYGGLACTLALEVFSPAFSGSPTSFFPGHDFSWFPLHTTTLVSAPVALVLGWMGNAMGAGGGQPAGERTSGPRERAAL